MGAALVLTLFEALAPDSSGGHATQRGKIQEPRIQKLVNSETSGKNAFKHVATDKINLPVFSMPPTEPPRSANRCPNATHSFSISTSKPCCTHKRKYIADKYAWFRT
jgi:hypothetical protein